MVPQSLSPLVSRTPHWRKSGRSLNRDQRDALDLVLDLLGEIEDRHAEARILLVVLAVRPRLGGYDHDDGKEVAGSGD